MYLSDLELRRTNRGQAEGMVFIGVDLGQRGSHSAMAVLERVEEWPVELADVLRGAGPRKRYVLRQVERMMLGTPYREVVQRLKRMVESVMAIRASCVVVVDESGAGVPVVEMMREAGLGCGILPYVITSGQHSTPSTVPRAELVTRLQLMVEREELEIAEGCREREQLERELVHLKLEGGSGSDDLALALALACWKARVR